MRTLLIYLSLFFLSIASIHAQGMKKMAQKTEFESRLAKEAQTVVLPVPPLPLMTK